MLLTWNLRLSLDTSQILEVKVVNCSIVKILGCVMGLPFLFRGINLCWILMCCILGRRGCAVVLGTQWLSTLGAII